MKKLDSSGFTLVEVVVTITVAAILIGVVTNFAIDSLTRTTISNTRADLISDAQSSLDVVTKDMRVAAGAEQNNRWSDPNSPGAPGNQYSWNSSANTIVLASPAVDENNDVIFSDPGQYISQKNDEILFVNNGVLYKRTVAAPDSDNAAKTSCPEALAGPSCPKDKVLMRNVESISYKYFNNQDEEVTPAEARSVEMTVNLKIQKYGQDITANYVTRAVFRNV